MLNVVTAMSGVVFPYFTSEHKTNIETIIKQGSTELFRLQKQDKNPSVRVSIREVINSTFTILFTDARTFLAANIQSGILTPNMAGLIDDVVNVSNGEQPFMEISTRYRLHQETIKELNRGKLKIDKQNPTCNPDTITVLPLNSLEAIFNYYKPIELLYIIEMFIGHVDIKNT